MRANAALALGLIAQVHRGDHFRGVENDGNHDDQVGEGDDLGFSHLPLPDYVFRAVEKAACPPEDPSVREGAARALGQFRDSRAHDLLTAIAASPTTGDDVQDRLLTLSSQRALTMIEPQNSVSPQSIVEAQRGLGALKQALGGGQP